MIKVKDGYGKLIGTTYQGSATQVLLSNGGNLEFSSETKANTLVQRNANQYVYATYFNSAISDEALTDIGSVYVRNTSDTFIRRISKTQFYSIIDNKFVTLDTAQTITGVKTFSTGPILAINATITQNQNSTSNYTTVIKWLKEGTSQGTYNPSIGQHNTGGDGTGSICILPYPTETSPWDGTVGLFISKGVLRLDGKAVAIADNYYTKTESDNRYVNVTGDTMTGPLIVKASITGTQLISNIANGTAPLKVTSKTVVTNLNSDLLDGYHETSFFRARGSQTIAGSIPTTTELSSNNNLSGNWNVSFPGASGHLVQFNTESGSTRYMQFYSHYSGSLYWRNSTDSTLSTKSWKTIVDSANYTGIVLKIGTATKGSATLPIYLNAGTPTACSTTLGVSITGNAAAARKIYKIDGTSRTWSTANSIVGNGLVGYADTSTSGRWDSYGSIFQFSNLDNPTPGTDGHWVTQIWSGTSNKLGVRWRTNTGDWSAMQTILTNTNYVSYADTRYVTALGTNGNYVTWTKNGTTNNLTVPFATTSNVLNNLGDRTAISGTTVGQSGLRLYRVYNNGYPAPYGNVLNIGGSGYGELLFQWTGDSNPGHLYYRSKRDAASQAWSNWVTILDNNNYSSTLDGRYVTLATNQTVSGIKTFSKQQEFTVATGTSPFTVSSTTVVSNLNADLLDGLHASKFYENGYTMFGYTINASSLNVDTYYPVTFSIGAIPNVRIECRVALNSETKPSWSTHAKGFSVRKIWEVNGSGWGTNPINRRILVSDYAFTSTDPVRGIDQMSYSSIEYVYVRGGGKYHFYISHNVVPTLRTSTYTNKSQSVSPTTSAPAAISTPTLTFTAGRFSALSYKPTTGINTVYIPTNTSHLTNDSGFLTGNVIRAVSANGYWGMARPDSNTSDWIRTTSSGIIPYQSGDRGTGHCGLGTSNWYFSSAYIDTVHGNLDGTASNADKLDGYHASAFSYKSWWHWSGQPGQPTWIWGGNSENNYYVYNPSNFSVNYATYSGSLSNNTSTDANTLYRNPGFTAWSVWSTFSNTPTNSYTNGINLNSSDTNYGWQLAKPASVDRPYYRGRQAGSFTSWKGIAFTSDVPTVTNYYWANIRVSASSSTSTSPTFSTAYTSNWFRSNGQTGWYSQTYDGGIYMTDTAYVRVYNGKRFYASGGYLAPYTGASWISMATRTNCITTDQNNSESSAHALFRVKNSSGHAIAFGGLGANIGFYGFYASRISSGANGIDWSTVWDAGTGVITHSKTIYTAGYYHSSVNSNNYVLLAGGSYKNLADFAKGNAGASNRGVYVTSGTVKAMTYYLNATVNSGSSGKLAYYSGTNSIDDYTSTKGSSSTPIYLNAGVPTACSGVIVKYWGWYNISCYSSAMPSWFKKGGNFDFVASVTRRSEGRYTVGTVYPSGYTYNNTIYWGSGRLNKGMSSNSSKSLLYVTMLNGYQSGSIYYLYVNTADDSTTNDGSFDIFFLCF